MTRRRAIIPQRKPVFVGCEGESEQAYGQLLNDILQEQKLSFHLEVVNLSPGAGDPVSRLHKAQKEIIRRKQRRSEFVFRVVFLDSDTVEKDPERRQQAEQLARKLGIHVIWQEPCHEGFLLRHIEGLENRRPPTSMSANKTLGSQWPDYRKPMTKMKLARRINLEAIRRAAAVERSLSFFLRQLTLLP